MKFLKWIGLLAIGCVLATSPARAQSVVLVLAPSTTSGVTNTTVTVRTMQLPQPPAGLYGLDVLLNVTAGGTATGTVQWFIEDSADGGTTWDDLVSSNTFALGGSAVTQRFFIAAEAGVPATVTGAVATNITQGSVAAVETLAAGSTRQGPFGDRLRIREKVSGASGSPVGCVYTITAVAR